MGTQAEWTSRVIEAADERAWDELFRSHASSRAVVTQWEVLSGWTPIAIGAYDRDALRGGLILAIRRVPKLPVSLGRVVCVMLGTEDPGSMLESLLAEIERVSLRRFVVETELRLRIPITDNVEGFGYHRDASRLLGEFGYRPLSKIDNTYYVRIDRSDDELLATFEATTRNRIKKAIKNGAVVSVSRDETLMERFYEAYVEMGERKRSPIAPKALVVEGLKPLIERGHAYLFTESYGGVVSNMMIVDALGVPCYIFGTRSEANVKGEVGGAAQVLHWEVMRFFRDRGKKYYDLGGCEGPTPIEGHPNFGVWRFKHGFRAPFVQFMPYHRKARGPLAGRILEIAHRWRGDYM